MTGSLQIKKGYYYVVICYKDEAGKTKYKWISTGLSEHGSRKEAKLLLEQEMEAFEEEQNKSKAKISRRGKPKAASIADATMLFSDYCEKYVDSIKDELSPTVYHNYKYHYVRVFREYFDRRKLRLIDITDEDLRGFYAERKASGLKNISLKHYNCVLRPALRQAYKDKIIPDNPFDYLDPIKKEKAPIAFYDRNEMKRLFELFEGHPLEVPFMLAAYYGFRRSEVLGLRWSSIDFDHKLITINHKLLVVEKEVIFTDQLKTKTSYRTLPLIPVIEEMLLRHKEKIEENKKFYGNVYDRRYTEYVCVEENGKIVYPDHLTKKFNELLKENGLKHIRLHDLRHSCASNMLASGVPMKEIQDWLGHANFSTTADVYSHLDFSAKVKAAKTIASVYGGNEPVKQTQSDELAIMAEALKEMKKLGFESLEDYLAYKSKIKP